jgi:hypothetical protein
LHVLLAHAQTKTTMTGEYYLEGVREVASGFKLNEDSSFQFFFSYGALDRYGIGTWQVKDGKLILNSKPQPEKDFALVASSMMPNNKTTIRIIENNVMLLPYVHATVKQGGQEEVLQTDSKGMITFPKMSIDTITLTFQLCPERKSTFVISNPQHNYLEFRFESWLMEVFFTNFSLHVDSDGLMGSHPLIQGQEFHYNK